MTNAIFISGSVKTIGSNALAELCEKAKKSSNGRFRYCLHSSPCEPIQNMVIALTKGSKLLPQRHLGSTKSFSIIEGKLALCVFNTDGLLTDSIVLNSSTGCKVAYFDDTYYVLTLALTEIAVYQEIISGQFTDENDYAPWTIDNQELMNHLTLKHGNLQL